MVMHMLYICLCETEYVAGNLQFSILVHHNHQNAITVELQRDMCDKSTALWKALKLRHAYEVII